MCTNFPEKTYHRVYKQVFHPLYDEMPRLIHDKSFESEGTAYEYAEQLSKTPQVASGFLSLETSYTEPTAVLVTAYGSFICFKSGEVKARSV